MDSGKRASMREGPLAALFRRTDEEVHAICAECSRRGQVRVASVSLGKRRSGPLDAGVSLVTCHGAGGVSSPAPRIRWTPHHV